MQLWIENFLVDKKHLSTIKIITKKIIESNKKSLHYISRRVSCGIEIAN